MPTNISVNFLLKTTKISVNLIGHFHCQNQNSLKHNKIKASFWSQKMLCIEIHRSPFTVRHHRAEECIENIKGKTRKLLGKMGKVMEKL